MITPTIEDYLKSIYSLEQSNNQGIPVSTNEIANAMNVSPSSVTKMLKKLSEIGFVEYTSHQGVRLTNIGVKSALYVIRKHRLLELFLQKYLNYSWDEVHEEACKLEHCISEKFENTINNMLGEPKFDPHGEPIPTKQGTIPEINAISLTVVKPGSKVKIRWIKNDKPELLKYLEEIGIQPNTEVFIDEIDSFGGTVAININETQKWIGVEVAQDIFVTPEN